MANASVPAMVDAELEAFSVLARRLTPEQWTTPSLCAGWTVRDIIEHTAFHTHRGLQDVRRPLGIGRDYPDAAMRTTLDLCTSAHGNILVLGSRRRPGRGLRLQANDIDWSKGRGAEVVGSAEALQVAAFAERTLARLPRRRRRGRRRVPRRPAPRIPRTSRQTAPTRARRLPLRPTRGLPHRLPNPHRRPRRAGRADRAPRRRLPHALSITATVAPRTRPRNRPHHSTSALLGTLSAWRNDGRCSTDPRGGR